jgi:hypothetical protein
MSLDRFVYWREQRPSQAELQTLLEDYVGVENAKQVEWSKDRWIVTLWGRNSSPFKRILEGHRRGHPLDERWFEVVVGESNIDVITRQQDELTNVVAAGFQALCLRYYKATEGPP